MVPCLGKASLCCFFYSTNVLSHCRVEQLKYLQSYFRGANVTACLSWSGCSCLTPAGRHDSITCRVPSLKTRKPYQHKTLPKYLCFVIIMKSKCTDSEFNHIPQTRIISVNISRRAQIRCVLMKDLDKSKCVGPPLSSRLMGQGSYQRNLKSSLKFTSV